VSKLQYKLIWKYCYHFLYRGILLNLNLFIRNTNSNIGKLDSTVSLKEE